MSVRIPHDKQRQVVKASPTAADTVYFDLVLENASVLVSLFVRSLSGTIDVSVETYNDAKNEFVEVIVFPQVSAPTTNLLLKKASVAMDNCRVKVSYSDAVDYTIHAKGLTIGSTDAKLLGAESGDTVQTDITSAAAQVLIPAALTARAGVMFHNTNTAAADILYWSYSAAKATTALGFPLYPGGVATMDIDSGVTIYATSAGATIDVRIAEVGG
jgi:hypothetical protein